MSAPYFAVETRKQCAIVVGDDLPLVTRLTGLIEGRGVAVFHTVKEVPDEYDLDYYLAVNTAFPSDFRGIRGLSLLPISSAPLENIVLPSSVTTIFYPDLVGEGINPSRNLLALLEKVCVNHAFELSGEGLNKQYFLHVDDLLGYTLESLFSQPSSNAVFLADPNSPSELSFAYLVKSTLPYPIELRYLPKESLKTPYLPANYSYKYSVLGYLPDLIKSALTLLPSEMVTTDKPAAKAVVSPHLSSPKLERHLKPLRVQPSRPNPIFVPVTPNSSRKLSLSKLFSKKLEKSHTTPFKFALTGIILGFSMYFTSLVFVGTLAYLTSRQLLSALITHTLPNYSLLKLASSSARYLEINLIAFSSIPVVSSLSPLQELIKTVAAYREGIAIVNTLNNLSKQGKDIVSYVLGGTENDINSVLENSKLEISTLYDQISLLDGSLPEEPFSIISSNYREQYLQLKTSLKNGRRAALSAKTILSTAPDLLGLGGRRKYLVLFQNNMELRPTGGFIGSFAILSFENGHLYDMPIYDVYTADGQLKGHVEPPKEIKEILGESNWYLRDSNWDPDFVTSARRAEWFLKKTLGIEVQGTIGINIYTLSDILRILGGVTLPDYNEVITADNIFERAEYYSEVNFFPGSTGKKEILSSIASTVFNTTHNLSLSQTLGVIKALAEGIDGKHTLIAVASPNTAKVFQTLGWDGSVREPDCPILGEGRCLSDYAYLVESNLGVNKANYFLTRQLVDNINLTGEGTISHDLKVSYTNRATSLSWPAGNYKNYARLYLPPSTTIISVAIDGLVLDPQNYHIYAERGKTVLGLLIEVPINSTVNLQVGYRLASTLGPKSSTYSYYWQKQPGTSDDPFTIKFSYSNLYEPDLISPRSTIESNNLGFSLLNNTDRRITIKFK